MLLRIGFSFMIKLMLKYSLFLVFATTLFACGSDEQTIPEGIIDRGELINIVVDVEVAQALIRFKLSHEDTLNQDQIFNEVYNNHHISQEDFNRSLVFYCKDPKDIEGLYIDVITSLYEKQAENQ
jgi:hypothetical protein